MQSYSYESCEILIAYVQDNLKTFYNTLKNSHFCHNVVTITVFFLFPHYPWGEGWKMTFKECEAQKFKISHS